MKHTSIRLSEDHAARIEATGESPTAIIKKALDRYFDIPDQARELMDEHIRLYHSAQPEHVVSTKHNVLTSEHKAQDKHIMSTAKPQSSSVTRDVAHDEHNDVPIIAHNLSTEVRTALEFIVSELREGREPTTAQVAEKVQMPQVGISRKLGELGISSQNTRREMKSVRIYTKPMLTRIDEILSAKD